MSLVVFRYRDLHTLEFIMTRPQITGFQEVKASYLTYMGHVAQAAAAGRKLHVVVNLQAVTSLDPQLWNYIKEMQDLVKQAPSYGPIVTQVTVHLSSGKFKKVLQTILPLCIGKGVKVTIL